MVALHHPTLSPHPFVQPPRPRLRAQVRPRRVAVVLNANARRVDEETLGWIRGLVASDELFLSRSLEEVPRIAAEIVTGGFDAVLWGGGDGTFALGVASVAAVAARSGRKIPEMGALRLGTGNGIADALGAGPATAAGIADDLRRIRRAPSARTLPMLNVEQRPTMFCGFGLDAQILGDFMATVEALKRAGLADRIRSANARYFLSVTSRSIPRFLTSTRPEIVAINRGSDAIKVDVHGQPIGAPIPAGRVLWRGEATLCSAGTIPFYGLGMRIFPHVDRMPGRFQLRMTDLGALEILTHLPSIFKGTYAHPRLHDFLVDDVELVLARPAALQTNGDLLGDRDRLSLSLWDRPIPTV